MNELTAYEPRDIGELRAFAQEVTATGLVPQAYRNKPADAVVAAMFGKETANLGPLTSLMYVAVVNGRPAFYSDALPGIAFQKKLIADMEESFEGEPYNDDFTAVCVVTRPSGSKVTQRFSVADAKKAGLWDKAGTWRQYPKRMLQWRARGWAIRDAAPHMLFGPTVEELKDIEEHRGADNAKVINPKPSQPMSAPQLVELYDADGAEFLLQPGEVAQWLGDQIEGATDEQLQALLENNPGNAVVCATVEAELAARQPLEAPPEEPAKPKSAKQRAQEIAQAFDGAPDIDELLKLEERLRGDIDRLPDIAKSRIAHIFHVKREELQKPSFADEMAALEPEEWRESEGRIEDERQGELMP